MTSPVTVSVIIPVHNEEASLEELHRRVRAALPDGEILFVDDGSLDHTRERLVALARQDSGVRVIGFRRRFGKSQALAAGLRRVNGSIVVTLDGDLQDAPEEIPRLLEKLKAGFDLVGGWRRKRHDPWPKVLASRCFNLVVSVLGGVRFRDINCGMKAFRREVQESIELATGFHRFLPLLAHWRGFRVCEVEVGHEARRHGKSRYGGAKVLRGVLDLIVVLFLLRFTARPGRYFLVAGCLLGTVGSIICLQLAIVWIRFQSIQSKFPRLALGMLFIIVGVQLLSMGLFAELVSYHFRSARTFEPAIWEALEYGREKESSPPRSSL